MNEARKIRTGEIIKLETEILVKSKEVAAKLEMLEAIVEDDLEVLKRGHKEGIKEGISMPFKRDETENFYRLRIKMGIGINGSLYVPKDLDLVPKKLLLTG